MVITLANQKGGTGKTTSAAAIAAALKLSGKKVLCVDAAPQCNLTHLLAADHTAPGIIEFLNGSPAEAVIQHTEQADIIAGSPALAAAQNTPPQILAERLEPIKRRYSRIVVDTDCGLSHSLLLALFAADVVYIPVIADTGSLLGLQYLKNTITAANQAGAKTKIGGAFFTQTNGRKTNAEKVIEDAMRQTCENLGFSVYRQQIRRADAVRAAAAFRESVIAYDPKSKPAADYMELVKEMKLT